MTEETTRCQQVADQIEPQNDVDGDDEHEDMADEHGATTATWIVGRMAFASA